MDLQQAINHPKVNVFDIMPGKNRNDFKVFTYIKDGESWGEWNARNLRNQQKVAKLKRPANNTGPLLKF